MRYPDPAQGEGGLAGTRLAASSLNFVPSPRMPVTNQALPSGYQLLNYRVDRQISRGGFSIVYRAFDEEGGPVAIKEYLPSSLVLRTEGDIVRASSAENLTSFRYGMKCFFEEGRALANSNALPNGIAQGVAHAVDRDPVEHLLEEAGDDHADRFLAGQAAGEGVEDLLVVHANPVDQEQHIAPDMSDEDLDQLLGPSETRLSSPGRTGRRVGTDRTRSPRTSREDVWAVASSARWHAEPGQLSNRHATHPDRSG